MVCYQRFHMPGFPLISWRWASTLKSIGFPVGLEAASMEYSFISALKELNRNIFHYIIPLPVFVLAVVVSYEGESLADGRSISLLESHAFTLRCYTFDVSDS